MSDGQTFTVSLQKDGMLRLPPELYPLLLLQAEPTLVFRVERGEVQIDGLLRVQRQIRAKYAERFPGMLAELLAERRAEAEHE